MWFLRKIRAPRLPGDPRPRSWRQSYFFWFGLLAVVLALLFFQSFVTYFKHSRTTTKLPVVVAKVETKDVPVYLAALGAVTPTYSVTVKTLINGTLEEVLFKEGQLVKTGDLIAKIDPRPYQAQLVEYQGQLERDKALLANANIDLERYQKLFKQDSVSQQVLATQQALVEQYLGAVKMDQGLIDAVQVNLNYCNIVAPIDGRIGLRLVDPGNFVQTSDTAGLAVINTINPITIIFTLPEDNIGQVMQQVNGGKILAVEAYDRSQQNLLAKGTLLTLDNQVNPATGTIKLRAQFDNDNSSLFPNQFVNVKLLVTTLIGATVVPTAALQYGAKSPYVYIVNDDSSVSMKPVKAGLTYNEFTVITGVNTGQSVVVDGADKLTDGAQVNAAPAGAYTMALHQLPQAQTLVRLNPLAGHTLV